MTRSQQIAGAMQAGAADINDDLTIILSAVDESLQEDVAPTRLLRLIREAAERISWKTSGMLNLSMHENVHPVPIPMERLILEIPIRVGENNA